MKTMVGISSQGSIRLRLEGPYGLRQKFMLNTLLKNAPQATDCLPVLFEEALARQGLYFVNRFVMEAFGAARDRLLISACDFSSTEEEYNSWLIEGKPPIEPKEETVRPEMKDLIWAIPSNENCMETLLQGGMVHLWKVEE